MGTHDYYLLGEGDRASATLKSSLSVREILSLLSGDSQSMEEDGLYPLLVEGDGEANSSFPQRLAPPEISSGS